MTEQRVRELLNAGLSPASAAAIAASEAIQEAAIEEGGPGGSSFPLTDDVSADGHTISDLADPVADGDAASKGYVDGNVGQVFALTTAPAHSTPDASWELLDLSACTVTNPQAWVTNDGNGGIQIDPSAGKIVHAQAWVTFAANAVGAVRGIEIAIGVGTGPSHLDDALRS